MANKKDDIIINTDNIDHILYNNQEVKKIVARQKNAQGEIIEQDTNWEQPFALSINKNEGINTITVIRTFTRTLAPINVELHDGDIVYNEDILSVSATRSEYYDVNTYPTSVTVSNNTVVSPTATRRVGNITIVKNENVAGVSLTYKDQQGTEHTVTAPGTYAIGKGYQYSWTATPNTGYDISQAAGTGVVEESETSDIVSPTASRKLWSLSITKSNYMAEVYYSLNSGTPIAITSTTQLTNLDFADTVVVTGTTQSETKYDYFNVQGLGTFAFIDNKRTQSTNVCCERDWHKFTITWKYRGSNTSWTTVNTKYIWDQIPGTDTPVEGTVPVPVIVDNGSEQYIPTNTWDDLAAIRSNRTITMGYEPVKYYAIFGAVANTTKPTDGWYTTGATPVYTANTNWSWGAANSSTKAVSPITSAGTYNVYAPDRVYCTFATVTNTTKPSNGWYDKDSSVYYTASSYCYFNNQGVTKLYIELTTPKEYSVAEPTYRQYTVTGTNCQYYTGATSGYYAYGQTLTTQFIGNGSSNNAYRFTESSQTKSYNVAITNELKTFTNNPTADYVYATFNTGEHMVNQLGNGWYTLGTHNNCWKANDTYAYDVSGTKNKSVDINTTNGTYNPPTITHGYVQATLSHCSPTSDSPFTGDGWYALSDTITIKVKANAGYSFTTTERDTKSYTVSVPGNAGTIIPANFYATFTGTNCTANVDAGWFSTSIASSVTWTADEGYCFSSTNNNLVGYSLVIEAGENSAPTTYKKKFKLTISVDNSGYSKSYKVYRDGAELSDGDTIYYWDVLTQDSEAADATATSWDAWGTVTNPSATSTGDATTGNLTVKNEDSEACVLYYNTTNSTSGASYVDGSAATTSKGTKTKTGLAFNTTYYYFATKTVTRSGYHYTYAVASDSYSGTAKVTGNVTAAFKFNRTEVADSDSKTGYSDILSHKTTERSEYTITWKYRTDYSTWTPDAGTSGAITTKYAYGETPSRTDPGTKTSGNERWYSTGWDNLGAVTSNRTITRNYTKQFNVTSTTSTHSTAYSNSARTTAFGTGWKDTGTTIYWKADSNCAYSSSGTQTTTSSVVAGANTKDATHYNVTSVSGAGAAAYTSTAYSTAFSTGWKAVGTIIYWKITATGLCFNQSNNSTTTTAYVVPGSNDITTSACRYKLTISVTGSDYGTYSVKRGTTTLSNGDYIYYGDVLTGSSSANGARYTGWDISESDLKICTGSWNGGDCVTPSITVTAKNSATRNLYRRTYLGNGNYSDWTHLSSNWGTSATKIYTDTGLAFSTTYQYHVAGYQYRTRYDRSASSSNYTGTSGVTGNVTASFSFSEDSGHSESNWIGGNPSTVDIATGTRNAYTISGSIYYRAIDGDQSYSSSNTLQENWSQSVYWGDGWSQSGSRSYYDSSSISGTCSGASSGNNIILYPHKYNATWTYMNSNGNMTSFTQWRYYNRAWAYPSPPTVNYGNNTRDVHSGWTVISGGQDAKASRDISLSATYQYQRYLTVSATNCSADYSSGWRTDSSVTVTFTCTSSYTFTANADVYTTSVTVNLPGTASASASAKPSLGTPTCSKYSNYNIRIYNTVTDNWTGHARSGSYDFTAAAGSYTYTVYVNVPWNGRYWDCYCTRPGWLESTWVSFYLST